MSRNNVNTSPRVPLNKSKQDTPSGDELARQTLENICLDTRAPAAARAQAARTLLELSGALKNTAADPKSKQNQELTLEELDARIAALDPKTRPPHDNEDALSH